MKWSIHSSRRQPAAAAGCGSSELLTRSIVKGWIPPLPPMKSRCLWPIALSRRVLLVCLRVRSANGER
eukprot:COSAG03_NODE_698_length_6210_cov_3.527901_6_plen_68_part_00